MPKFTVYELADKLWKLPDVEDIEPVVVTIQGQRYEGVQCTRHLVAPPGCEKPGPYTVEQIYLLGRRPSIAGQHCFTIPDDDRDWYVAGFYEGEVTTLQPFGAHFTLMAWNHKDYDGDRIDKFGHYHRFPIAVHFFSW